MTGSSASMLWPMLGHIGWTFVLYAWLSLARTGAVKRGELDWDRLVLGRDEPIETARIARNLANQFELPVIFYAVAVTLMAFGRVTNFDLAAAWVFFAGRIVHTLVQTMTDNVPLRGLVFMINFTAVAVLVAHLALLALQSGEG